jgi:hypothetical protein
VLFLDITLQWQPSDQLLGGTPSKSCVDVCLLSWSWAGWHGGIDTWSWPWATDFLKSDRHELVSYGAVRTIPTVQWYCGGREKATCRPIELAML